MLTFDDFLDHLENEAIKITLGEESVKIEKNKESLIKKIELENYSSVVKSGVLEILRVKIVLPKKESYGINILYGKKAQSGPFQSNKNGWRYYIYPELNENVHYEKDELTNLDIISNRTEDDIRRNIRDILLELGLKNVIITFKNEVKSLSQRNILENNLEKEEKLYARV